MIKEKIFLKEGEQIDLKKLFNLKNQNIERIILTLKDEGCQEGGLVKITLIGEEGEISKTISKEYAFLFNNSLETVQCFLTALKDSTVLISIKLKKEENK